MLLFVISNVVGEIEMHLLHCWTCSLCQRISDESEVKARDNQN